MSYVDEVLEIVQKKNADQPEFLQAVTEVLDSLRPCIEANEELYRKNAILERITEPDARNHIVYLSLQAWSRLSALIWNAP